jgi:hypothetical protein
MDMELLRSKVVEIKVLHQEVLGSVKMTLDKVIKIGRLLTECKEQVGYGMWMTWVEANHESLGFNYSTANNYINCYERKDDPRFSTVKNLSDIYYPQKQLEHKLEKVKEPKQEPKYKEPERVADEWNPETGHPTHYIEPKVEEAEKAEVVEEEDQDDTLEFIKEEVMKLDKNHINKFSEWYEGYLEERSEKEAA